MKTHQSVLSNTPYALATPINVKHPLAHFFVLHCGGVRSHRISIVFPIDHLTWRGRCTAWTPYPNKVSNDDLFWTPLLSVRPSSDRMRSGDFTSSEKYCML